VRSGLADTCSGFTLKWRVCYSWSQAIRGSGGLPEPSDRKPWADPRAVGPTEDDQIHLVV
jgi:hypothetical protein